MAAECHSRFGFQFQSKLRVEFDGGAITGDAGLVLLREFDERLGLTTELEKLLIDERDRRYTRHSALELVRQRIYQIGAGYEDGNDADFLRDDPTMRAVVRKRSDRKHPLWEPLPLDGVFAWNTRLGCVDLFEHVCKGWSATMAPPGRAQ